LPVEKVIQEAPGYNVYHFVADQLNTHKSETLVRLVAKHCGIDIYSETLFMDEANDETYQKNRTNEAVVLVADEKGSDQRLRISCFLYFSI
jgi:hypothetical protein